MKKILFILLSIQMLFALEVKEIKKGDVIEDSIQRLEKKYYKVGIHNLKNIRVTLTNMTKDVDLYLKTETFSDVKDNNPMEQRVPTIRRNDCYSSNGRGENEECYYRVIGPAPGTYDAGVYILVYGFEAGSYRLEVKEEEAEKIDEISEKPTNGKVKKGESKQYKIYGKAGETIEVSLFDLSDDADLRLKIGRKAALRTFDCKSINGGTKTDSCSVSLKKDSWVYAQVYGYQNAKYSIKRTQKIVNPTTYAYKVCHQEEVTSNSNLDVICNKNSYIDGAFVLIKDKSKLLYTAGQQSHAEVTVKRGHGTAKIFGNNDAESFTVAYTNNNEYTFYCLSEQAIEVLNFPIPKDSIIKKTYIAQRNSDIWQIYIIYSNNKTGVTYKNTYTSTDYVLPYKLESHKEIPSPKI